MKWKILKKWVNDFHSKTDTSLVSIVLPLRRANFSKRKNLKSILLMGFRPLDPQQGATPAPRWGPGRLADSTTGREPLAPSASYFFLFSCYFKS